MKTMLHSHFYAGMAFISILFSLVFINLTIHDHQTAKTQQLIKNGFESCNVVKLNNG